MKETKMNKTALIIFSFLGSIGIILSVVLINIGHLLIIGFKILTKAIVYMAIVIGSILKDEYRKYNKNKQKRAKK